MRIAMVGTRGVPARYGGFETCVEEVGRRLAGRGPRGRRLLPHGRAARDGAARPATAGMRLVHLPAVRRKRSLETLSHTGAVGRAPAPAPQRDAALSSSTPRTRRSCRCCGCRGCPVATHVDGLEWQRAKWGPSGRRYYRMAEALAVRWSDALIADAQRHQRLLRRRVRRRHELDHLRRADHRPTAGPDRLAELGLEPRRLPPRRRPVRAGEPRRRHRRGLPPRARAELPLVVVGSAPYADAYTARINDRWPTTRGVRFLGRRLGPGAARPALRQRLHLPARALRRRHQPVAAAGHGRRQPRSSPST